MAIKVPFERPVSIPPLPAQPLDLPEQLGEGSTQPVPSHPPAGQGPSLQGILSIFSRLPLPSLRAPRVLSSRSRGSDPITRTVTKRASQTSSPLQSSKLGAPLVRGPKAGNNAA